MQRKLKEEYKNYKVGDKLIVTNNPDWLEQNGKIVTVTDFSGNTMICRDEVNTGLEFRKTTFRKLTKLDKALL